MSATSAPATIPDQGARLSSLTLEHPDPDRVDVLFRALAIDRAPVVVLGSELRYRAAIRTRSGMKELT